MRPARAVLVDLLCHTLRDLNRVPAKLAVGHGASGGRASEVAASAQHDARPARVTKSLSAHRSEIPDCMSGISMLQ